MSDKLLRRVKEMMLTPALSGHEERMTAYMKRELAASSDHVASDRLGNVIARIDGKDSEAPRVMVFAHMDQLGFIVRKVEPEGFLRVERLGGIPEKVLPGVRVWVEAEDGTQYPGLIAPKAHHITPAEEKYVVTPIGQLFIDIGFSSKQEVEELGIYPGCAVVYQPQFDELLNDRFMGTSADNRNGCAVILELADRFFAERPGPTVYIVGSVLEEFNLRGAMVAAQVIQPDIAISVDGGVGLSDTPDLANRTDGRMGAGPGISKYNFHGRGTLNGTLPHPAILRSFMESARKSGIPFQRGAGIGGLTDLSYVQLVGKGVAALDVGTGGRYAHSPVEMRELGDMRKTVDLLEAAIRPWGAEMTLLDR